MANVDHVKDVPVDFVEPLTTTEAARRLDVEVTEVYDLLFAGHLRGGPDLTGTVKIDARSIDELIASGGARR